MVPPICPMCEQDGVHPSSDACAAALRLAISAYARRLSRLHPEEFLARWTAYGVAFGLCARTTRRAEPRDRGTGEQLGAAFLAIGERACRRHDEG
jgi:hypothetical protein